MRRLFAIVLGVLIGTGLTLAGNSSAHADLSKAVQKKFKGKILVTEDGELSTTFESDTEQIANYNKANKKVITGVAGQQDVKTWNFYVMAFMSKAPKSTQLSLDFYRVEGKTKVYAANKRLSGIDTKLTLLSTRISLTEDDGLNAGRTYIVKLTAQRGKREIVLAETKLTTK